MSTHVRHNYISRRDIRAKSLHHFRSVPNHFWFIKYICFIIIVFRLYLSCWQSCLLISYVGFYTLLVLPTSQSNVFIVPTSLSVPFSFYLFFIYTFCHQHFNLKTSSSSVPYPSPPKRMWISFPSCCEVTRLMLSMLRSLKSSPPAQSKCSQ